MSSMQPTDNHLNFCLNYYLFYKVTKNESQYYLKINHHMNFNEGLVYMGEKNENWVKFTLT